CLTALLAAGVSSGAMAQSPRLAFAQPSPGVRVTADVPFDTADGATLAMDLYQLPRARGARPRVALIFFNQAMGADRRGPLYTAWARAAASQGLVGILPDLRQGRQARDFEAVLRFLTSHSSALGIDTAAIAVYAASGNVFTALPVLEQPSLTAVRAAVIYYGTGPVTTFRRDLPLLWVRAGLDRPEVNQEIAALASRAIAQNAPVTLLNHPTGYHGFELFNDDDATRAVIVQTLAFVRQATSRPYQRALAAGAREAAAAGAVQSGNYHEAAELYAELAQARPSDARLRLSLGESLLGDGRYREACSLFESLKDRGLGYRDLGLPAARACARAGDGDAAIGWLRSIPSRFLPRSVADDSAFASIRGRPDFTAIFSVPPQ
ncbi:MAG TPA: tetratricopeptide repeat protein, partial [Gemmatimonadaceae bacterium]|nr:tetratricopeptide repeat protein [Gemmatimonadaceae bacterium]